MACQVDGDGTLPPVVELEHDVGPGITLGKAGLSQLVAHRVAARRFHLDDRRAHVGHEGRGARRGDPVGDLDDGDVL